MSDIAAAVDPSHNGPSTVDYFAWVTAVRILQSESQSGASRVLAEAVTTRPGDAEQTRFVGIVLAMQRQIIRTLLTTEQLNGLTNTDPLDIVFHNGETADHEPTR